MGTAGGENGLRQHSTGNVLPVVAKPWGFNHWAPQTTNDRTSWWFDADTDTFRGIRCTHQPSPWIGDYGWFVLRPFLGGFGGDEWIGFTSYRVAGALQPWLLDLVVGPLGVRMELAPTDHGALLRVTFPALTKPAHRRVCAWVPKGNDDDGDERRARSSGQRSGECHTEAGGIDLLSRRFSGGVPEGSDFGLRARLEAAGLQAEEDLSECFEHNVKYVPLDMPGQQRTTELSARACQARCANVPGCSHFTFWPDGGCHLQDHSATSQSAASLTAGSPHCPENQEVRQCCFLLGERLQAEIRIGTSFLSAVQSLRALDEEIVGHSIERLAAAGRAAWHSKLMAVEVLDAGQPSAETFHRLEIFYSCLYRALLFPRRLDEHTPDGIRHWSPYDGRIREGPGVTDNGFWDTFRTVYPLLSLAYPQKLGEIIAGWLDAYKAGGWLPKWASPGYRDSMVGTFADVTVADAILKNISGFDVNLAWEALHKDSFQASPPKDTSRGKFGLAFYMDKGYIPVDVNIPESCSRTLDFAFADAAVASVAQRLGHVADAQKLHGRSVRALSSLYDPVSGLMGHRKNDGGFNEEPAQTWGDCFTEGSAWHHSFPPFNLTALAELHGGEERLLGRLQALFNAPSDFMPGSYQVEIHEMREMRMLAMGQYAHNNQPAHHLPYVFAMLGDRNATAALVRRVLSRAYSLEGFAGDEDNGEMGSWFVLSALGLYAAAPGASEDYVLGAVPLFPKVRLRDLDLVIEAPAAEQLAPVPAKVFWRGRPLDGPSIGYSVLRSGGVLHFASVGDARFGQIVSSLRGAMHQAARRVQRDPQSRRPPRAAGAEEPGPYSVDAEMAYLEAGQDDASSPGPALLLAAFVAALLWRGCCRKKGADVEDHAD